MDIMVYTPEEIANLSISNPYQALAEGRRWFQQAERSISAGIFERVTLEDEIFLLNLIKYLPMA
jgi:hypothetical protein